MVGELVIDPRQFSPRHVALNEAHLSDLAKPLKEGHTLAPLIAWKTAGKLVLVDGHHRAEAYRRARWARPIPIRTFEGTRTEAKLVAVRENARAKLPLTQAERLDWAWSLVWDAGRPTLEVIAAATGAGIASVKRMSSRARDMTAARKEPTGSWARDQRDEMEPWTDEMKAERYAAKTARLVEEHRGLARAAVHYPEATADAVAAIFGRKLPDLIRNLVSIAEEQALDLPDEPDEFRGDAADNEGTDQ
jgi:ParB-like chromosome segregation protein Spo0J